MNLSDISDNTRPDQLAELPNIIAGMALIAHLSGNTVFPGCQCQSPRFVDRMGEGFLHIHMLAHLHGRHGCDGVDMVRGGNCAGVDIPVFFFQHVPKIAISFRIRVSAKGS